MKEENSLGGRHVYDFAAFSQLPEHF